MELKFSSKAKAIGKAYEKGDKSALIRLFDPESADYIADCLDTLQAAANLHEIMNFKQFDPHPLQGKKAGVLSLHLNGRKVMEVRTLDRAGKLTKKLDYNATNGLVLEVTEHYGD